MHPRLFVVLLVLWGGMVRAGVEGAGAATVVDIAGYYADPTFPGCSVFIEYTTPAPTVEEDAGSSSISSSSRSSSSDLKNKPQDKKKSKKKSKKNKNAADMSRKAIIVRSLPGDGEVRCFFNNSDIRLPPIISVVQPVMATEVDEGQGKEESKAGRGPKALNITSDFSAVGGGATRRGVFDLLQTIWPPQLVWEAEALTSSSQTSAAARAKRGGVSREKGADEELVWVKLPFSGLYSDKRFPGCRRHLSAETLQGALLTGTDAQSQAVGCDGQSDVLWQNSQKAVLEHHKGGARITVHYSRRYSYSQEVWEQIRILKREEANALSGRALDDVAGDWWDRSETVSGSLQPASGNIMWDDGTLWERLDDSQGQLNHNKNSIPTTGAVGTGEGTRGGSSDESGGDGRQVGRRDTNARRSENQKSIDRRKEQVERLREKAAKHSSPNKKQQMKQRTKKQEKLPQQDSGRKNSWGSGQAAREL